MSLVQIDDLSVAYENRTIVEHISLNLEPGEILALRGENGVGKTSILACVAGTQPPTSGRVTVDGRPVDESSVRFRRAVATVLDDTDFLPGLSVVEHLELIARVHCVDDPHAAALGMTSELGLAGQRGQDSRTLSSGQRRRLGLGTALVRPAKLYLFDEPEQRLDTAGIAWLGTRLNALAEGGAAVIMASHDGDLLGALRCTTIEL